MIMESLGSHGSCLELLGTPSSNQERISIIGSACWKVEMALDSDHGLVIDGEREDGR